MFSIGSGFINYNLSTYSVKLHVQNTFVAGHVQHA